MCNRFGVVTSFTGTYRANEWSLVVHSTKGTFTYEHIAVLGQFVLKSLLRASQYWPVYRPPLPSPQKKIGEGEKGPLSDFFSEGGVSKLATQNAHVEL